MLQREIVLPQLRRLTFHRPGLFGGQVSYTHMRPPMIVDVDDLVDTPLRVDRPTEDFMVEPFRFQDAVRTLCDGVFVRVAILGHADYFRTRPRRPYRTLSDMDTKKGKTFRFFL